MVCRAIIFNLSLWGWLFSNCFYWQPCVCFFSSSAFSTWAMNDARKVLSIDISMVLSHGCSWHKRDARNFTTTTFQLHLWQILLIFQVKYFGGHHNLQLLIVNDVTLNVNFEINRLLELFSFLEKFDHLAFKYYEHLYIFLKQKYMLRMPQYLRPKNPN